MFTPLINLLATLFVKGTGGIGPDLQALLSKLIPASLDLGTTGSENGLSKYPNVSIFTSASALSDLQNLGNFGFTSVLTAPSSLPTGWENAFEEVTEVPAVIQTTPSVPAIQYLAAISSDAYSPTPLISSSSFIGYVLHTKIESQSGVSELIDIITEGGKSYLYFRLPFNFEAINVNCLVLLNTDGIPIAFLLAPTEVTLVDGTTVYVDFYFYLDPSLILNPETANIDNLLTSF